MKIRFGILEDEKPFVDEIKESIRTWAAEKNCLAEIQDYQTSDAFFFDFESGADYDVLFLDIMLPSSLNGMQVAERIRTTDQHTIIIFLTSNTEYIADGYDVSALRYLLKPIRYPKIRKSLDKAYDILSAKKQPFYLHKNKNTETRLEYHEIMFFTSFGQHIEIHTKHEKYIEWNRLSTIEKDLPLEFVRCHRAYVVNIASVRSIQPKSLVLINNEIIPIGDYYVKQVKEKWMYYYG